MPKTKAEEKADSEEKPDGLEIISIGSVYSGPWDKKYRSCSRGKDRYPYPVGYHAVRANNGITYKMEIHEGPKGPLFVITSADGRSVSGQTPDIAWDKFQRKGCIRTKLWHGKRFSCKIDGVEFFGLKNPFVQRLLRELVANVTPEVNPFTSNLCNGTSGTELDDHCADTCTDPDVLPHLVRPVKTGKRSRRYEVKTAKPVNKANLKRPRTQHPTDVSLASNSGLITERNHSKGRSVQPAAKEGIECQEALPASVHVSYPAGDADTCHITEKAMHVQEGALASSECRNCTQVANNLSTDDKFPDRSQRNKVEEFSSTIGREDNAAGISIREGWSDVNGIHLCAPDTLDLIQVIPDSAPVILENTDHSQKNELAATDIVTSKVLGTESQPEGETGTLNSGSVKSEFDSVGEDMVKSMMTFLLPQAVPLLKTGKRKKNTAGAPLETLPCGLKSRAENNNFGYTAIYQNPASGVTSEMLTENKDPDRGENIHTQSANINLILPGLELIKSVIPDSLENDQGQDHVTTEEAILSSDIAEAGQKPLSEGRSPFNSNGQLVSVDMDNESLVCHAQTNRGNHFCINNVCMPLHGRHHENNVHALENTPGCTSPSEKVFSEETKNNKSNMEERAVRPQIHLEGKDLKTAPDYSNDLEPTCSSRFCVQLSDALDANASSPGVMLSSSKSPQDVVAKAVVAKTDIVTVSQVPLAVYTRKKSRGVSNSTTKYDIPLSEGTKGRNFGDFFVPEPPHLAKSMHALEIHPINCLLDNQQNKESIPIEAQSHGLYSEETYMESEVELDSICPVLHQDQAVAYSKDKDTSGFLDPSVLHTESFGACVDGEVVGQKNSLETHWYWSCHEKERELCGNEISDEKENGSLSNLSPHCNMELYPELKGMVQLVGCYFHPIPVLSLLLCKKGDAIYICLLCGPLGNKNRTIFSYNVEIQEPRVGNPSILNHTAVTMPILKDYSGREIALERSGFQLTPDGECLVLLDSIRMPYCRAGITNCSCSTCKLDNEENAVKIVQVKLGYVSVVAKLKTVDCLHCILVCKPNHLVAVGESGRLHLWVMNSTWSAQTGNFIMPSYDCISPGIVELKRVPEFSDLVVGHNGFGEFSLWDISKRTVVSKFSGSSTSVYQFFPITLFSRQRKGPLFNNSNVEDHAAEIMAATDKCFFEKTKNHSSLQLKGEDIGIWLFVSTQSDSGIPLKYIDCQISQVGWWKLALLANNMVTFGLPLDSRVSSIGALAGQGIIGTSDGLVYMWELSTGTKLGSLLRFKGSSVSCIATDDMDSGVLAVAGADKLLIYMHSKRFE